MSTIPSQPPADAAPFMRLVGEDTSDKSIGRDGHEATPLTGTRPMHVQILNQTFHPDVAATGQLMWDLARHLDSRGHRVTVITSRQFYGTDRLHDVAHERVGNIDIHRLRGTAFGKKKLIGRAMDFVSFYGVAALALARLPAPDVCLCLTSPPFIATLAGLNKQARILPDGRHSKLVYHVMDLYPDVIYASGMAREKHPAIALMHRLTSRSLDVSDAVIALGDDMRDRLLARYPHHARADRIHVVQPWAEGDALFPLAKADNPLAARLGLDKTFNVVYSGNLGIAHDLETMAGAIELTGNEPAIRWVFIGGGKRFEVLKAMSSQKNWANVAFLPFADRSDLNNSLNLADVHLVSQLPAFTGVVVPSKLFGILAVGKPAIMIGPDDAENSRILRRHACGAVIPNGDAAALAATVRQMAADENARHAMGARARQAFETRFDKPVACRRIEQILSRAVFGG